MSLFWKITFIIISFIILSILIFWTYITTSYTNTKLPKYEKQKYWLYEIIKEQDNTFLKKEIDKIPEKSWNLLLKKISPADKIIFSTGTININKKNWIYNIEVSPWLYYFDFKDISSIYKINSNWFEINNLWPWSFILNTINPKNNILFSINSLLEMKLKNVNNNEDIITNLDLYPHMYLIFDVSKNIFLKNSDLLRISQIFSLWYFWNQIYNEGIKKDFLDIITLKKDENIDEITNIYNYKKETYKNNLIEYNDFLNYSFLSLPWENLIIKYSNLFINPKKMNIFHQNIILRNLNSLIKDNWNTIEIIDKIYNSHNEIKKLDNNSYKIMGDIINYYYQIILNSNIDIDKKITFSSLYYKINNIDLSIYYKSLIFLENIYYNYDYVSKEWFSKNISTFKNNYFYDLNISIDWKTWNNTIENIEKVDYLLFFLQNIIEKLDFSKSNDNTTDIINIFIDYVEIWNSFYNKWSNEIKRTWLFSNYNILKELLWILYTKSFNKERNKDWLLTIKDDSLIFEQDILKLEKWINIILDFYNSYSYLLYTKTKSKDQILNEEYSKIKNIYIEYFSALKNYKEYTIKYDKSKSNLLSAETILEKNETSWLSKNKAIEYLNNFNWLILNNIEIKIMDYSYCLLPIEENEKINIEYPYCYKIDSLYINWKKLDFILHPFENNKIENIYLNNEKKAWSYKLDDLKIEMDKKYKSASEEEKKQYLFKNFFLNTFNENIYIEDNKETTKEEQLPKEILEEDTVVKIFKRNKLLWEYWDFSSLVGFLDINYNDLLVTKNENDSYSIFLKNWKINVSNDDLKFFSWIFSSSYIFEDKHSFINPEIELIDEKNNRILLLWNKIKINWEYKVENIKKEIIIIFNNFKFIDFVVRNIYNLLGNEIIDINYIKKSNIVNIKTNYMWKELNIKLFSWKIFEVIYNNNNYINKTTNYLEIEEILNNIK